MDWDFLVARDSVIVGTPEYVAERINYIREVSGLESLLCDFDLPYLTQPQIMSSIERFVTDVMPLVNGAETTVPS